MVNSLYVCLDLICFQLINKTSLLLYCQYVCGFVFERFQYIVGKL